MASIRPNFERFRLAITREGLPDRVPVAENDVDFGTMGDYLGRPISDIESYVAFWQAAGYDYVACEVRGQWISDSFQKKISEGIVEMPTAAATVSSFGPTKVTDERSFDEYPWIGPADAYYRDVELVEKQLPEEMKIVAVHGPIFSGMMRIMGLETLSIAAFENPGLVRAVADRIGNLAVNIIETLAQRESVGAIWFGDDIAYAEGLFFSPRFLREYIFPFYARIGEVCRRYDKPFIYHSDGKLEAVFEDLLSFGVQAVHPNEPQSVDIVELKRRVGHRVSLIGNIDVDLLGRGTPEDVVRATRALIDTVAPGGGFVLGSGNSIADYVPLANYRAMQDTVREYGDIYG